MSKKIITKKNNFLVFFNKYWHLITVLIITTVVGLWLIYLCRNMLNPDGVSYIQISKHYANFDIKHAVNGYWAPLMSWLIVPFIWLGFNPLYTFRLINLFLCLIIIGFLGFKIGNLKTKTEQASYCLLLTSFGLLLTNWAASVLTPDILSGCVLLFILYYLSIYHNNPNNKNAMILGTFLSLLYFAKSIGLYVSIIILIITITYMVIKGKLIKRSAILLIICFIMPILLWIGAISLKYNKFTTSTAASYNMSLIGPTRPPHPQTIDNIILQTHNSNDIWVWDDPSYLIMPKWNIFKNLNYYISNCLINCFKIFTSLFQITPLIMFSALIIAMNFKKEKILNIYLILSCSLISLAYSAILVESRYLWIIAIPLVSCAILQYKSFNLKNKIGSVIVCILLFLVSISSSFLFYINSQPIIYIFDSRNKLSLKAAQLITAHSKVAKSTDGLATCYIAKLNCIGNFTISQDSTEKKIQITKMKQAAIKYYFEYSQPRKDIELPIVYSGTSKETSCYDYINGKDRMCPTQGLTVYKIN